jgi:hypothetical protein
MYALPDFYSTFVLKIDACLTGLRAVLSQNSKTVGFLQQGH